MGYKVFILTTVALNESNLFWSEMTVRKSFCVIVWISADRNLVKSCI